MPSITIHGIRHAQGYHNLNTANHTIHDPLLTPLGESQCSALAQSFPYTRQITHLVASPLRRTIFTTLLSFPNPIKEGMKIIALPEVQETSDLPCDTGSERKELEDEFSGGAYKGIVDLNLVQEGWNSKQGKWGPQASEIEARARVARMFLRDLGLQAIREGIEEVHIAVVTHGGFLHYFTEDWTGHGDFEGTGWANTEWRSYAFVGGDEVGNGEASGNGSESESGSASLKETEESRRRRRGHEKPLGEAEQRNLREVAEKDWEGQGFTAPKEESAKL